MNIRLTSVVPVLAGVAAALTLAGCAAAPQAAPAPTVTVTAEAAPTPTVTVTADPAPKAAATKAAEDRSAGNSGTFTVPNAVGMNYQDAQDLWRSKGLVVLPAEDATGANRMPMIDSGWVVLGQDPKPGTPATDGDSITALVKKYSDD